MTIEPVDIWLKNTIPGIVLLGAIGSIVAAVLIWFIHKFIFPRFITGLTNSITTVVGHFLRPAVKQIVYFILKNGEQKLPIFYTFQTMKLILSLFISTCCFILFALGLMNSDQNLYRGALLVPLTLSFLTLWYGLRCIAIVMLPLYADIEDEVKEAKKNFLEKRNQENSRPKPLTQPE